MHKKKVCLAQPTRVRRKCGRRNELTKTTLPSVPLAELHCTPTEGSCHLLIRTNCESAVYVSIEMLKVLQLDNNICHNDKQPSAMRTSLSRILNHGLRDYFRQCAVAGANCGGHTSTVLLLHTTQHTKDDVTTFAWRLKKPCGRSRCFLPKKAICVHF